MSLPVDTPSKLTLLERNKGITSFENEPVSVNLDSVCNSETVIKFVLDVVPSSEPELWLRKQELIKEGKPKRGQAYGVGCAPICRSTMQQAGVVPVGYSNIAVELLADNAAPEAEAVYGALGMPFSALVFGLRQYYSQA
jgi:hypothetical protein